MDKENNTIPRMNQRYAVLALNRGKGDLGILSQLPEEFIPNPTELDYTRGKITRYFIRKSNDKKSPVIEVSGVQYEAFKKNPLYINTTLIWLLTGPINDGAEDGQHGVYDSNLKQILKGDEKLEGISMKLHNPLQFYYNSRDMDTHIPIDKTGYM